MMILDYILRWSSGQSNSVGGTIMEWSKPGQGDSDTGLKKLASFLALRDFNEYMERLEDFVGLPGGSAVFRKEMDLMETDSSYTHRQKDAIRRKKTREIVAKLHGEIDSLCDAITQDGPYIPLGEAERQVVEILYRFPDGKNGDVNHAIVQTCADSLEVTGDIFHAIIPCSAFREIERILLPTKNFFAQYDFSQAGQEEGTAFLLKYNRIFQVERLMWQVNWFTQEYRNLRSIKDTRFREILKSHHERIASERDEIYERLIGESKTNARWISEQKAYAIVKAKYPDAKFQYQPEWIMGQRLDIFIPSLNAGIEYQGKQHTETVEFFGGERALKDNQERDRRKKLRCGMNHVKLVYWNYDQPLTEEYFTEHIEPLLFAK